MFKITLEAENEPELESRLRRALNADRYLMALSDIQQEIFRPARKHGYSDPHIAEALAHADENQVIVNEAGVDYKVGAGTELISLLEDKFLEILRDNSITLDEW